MDPGSNDFRSANVNDNLCSPPYRLSSGIPVLDDSVRVSNLPSSGYRDNIGHDKSGSFMCLGRPQADYMHSHSYALNNSKENDSHFIRSFNELSQSCSRKHSLSGVVRTRRRKAGISEEERVCIVCGEPASGYNFDRLTCESCKAFFRRNALKPRDKVSLLCHFSGCMFLPKLVFPLKVCN